MPDSTPQDADSSDAAASDHSASEVAVNTKNGEGPLHPMERTPESTAKTTSRNKPSPYIFMGAGIEFTAVTGAFAAFGWWLDGQWGTGPWLMITGLGIGMIGGTYKLWRLGRIFFR